MLKICSPTIFCRSGIPRERIPARAAVSDPRSVRKCRWSRCRKGGQGWTDLPVSQLTLTLATPKYLGLPVESASSSQYFYSIIYAQTEKTATFLELLANDIRSLNPILSPAYASIHPKLWLDEKFKRNKRQ